MKSSQPISRRQKTWALGLILVALTLLAYGPALRGGFIWDDDDYVTNNPNLTSIDGLWDIWAHPTASPQYYPMVFTTFWVEHHLWGIHPFGYHLDNILLHAISCVLLWRILSGLRIRGCYLAACLFAVHPLMVESVAWVTERKNVLSGVFYLAAAMVYLKADLRFAICNLQLSIGADPNGDAEPNGEEPNGDGPRFGETAHELNGAGNLNDLNGDGPRFFAAAYSIALLLFVLALLSKTVTCSWPAAILLVIWWKRGRIRRRDVLAMIPFFLIGIALAMNTAIFERTHVQAVGAEWHYGLIDRILIASRAIWFYATKIVLPIQLSFVYPKWKVDPHAPWQWGFLVGIVAGVFVLWRMRGRWGRGPLAGTLFFMGTLVPALGFFNIYPMRYTLVADHYAYLASLGLLVLIAGGIHRLSTSLPRAVMIAIPTVPLLALTLLRANVYRNSESLWRDALTKNPDSWMVHLNLAKVLVNEGRLADAIGHFEAQLRLAPKLPETHWNFAGSLYDRGQLDAAIREYTEAIRLGRDHPLPQALFGRGRAYLQQGKLDAGERDFQHAIQLKPDYAQAHNYLGTTYVRAHQFEPALRQFQTAITIDPHLAEARVNLASLLSAMGDQDRARAQFDAAVAIDPSLEQFRRRVLNPGGR